MLHFGDAINEELNKNWTKTKKHIIIIRFKDTTWDVINKLNTFTSTRVLKKQTF